MFEGPSSGPPMRAARPQSHVAPPAQPLGSRVTLTVRARSRPTLVCSDPRRERRWRQALEEVEPGCWRTQVLLPLEPTLLRYHFVFANGRRLQEDRPVEGRNRPVYGRRSREDFQLAVYDPSSPIPDWVEDAVFYQVFPDRFANGDPSNDHLGAGELLPWHQPPELPPRGRDFYGGDLRGLMGALDYLHDLGINALYLTPILASPSNHRYDALDYFRIDPRLGTLEDFRALVREMRRRGMRLLLDGVFDHCSHLHPYFLEAQNGERSPYAHWFEFQRRPHRYTSWAGLSHMPQFREVPEVEGYFFGPQGVASHWLGEGAHGWRVDVVPWKSEGFWRLFGRAMRQRHPQAYLVAEEWGNASRYLLGDTFQATMNYRFAWAVLGFAAHDRLAPSGLEERLSVLRRDTPEPCFRLQLNLLDSHDTARLATRCGGDERRIRQAAALQLAYPGVPCIYYGDELGLEGAFAEDGRRPFPWEGGNRELQAFYRRAIRARREAEVLRRGELHPAVADDARGVFAFWRRLGERAVLAVFSQSPLPLDYAVPLLDGGPAGEWPDLLGDRPALLRDGQLRMRLPPRAACWFASP